MSTVTGWADVAGGRLPYEVAGDGPGVVLAHAGIADMRQWDPQWEALAAAHRVVRYDLRGFGRADVVDTRFSNRADLVAVMDAAGLDRAVLVGCSRAGSIVIDTALEYPDRVSGLVWVCGGLSGYDDRGDARRGSPRSSGRRSSRRPRTGRPCRRSTSRSGSTASASPMVVRLLRRARPCAG